MRRRLRAPARALILAAALAVAGCGGYSLVGVGGDIPADVRNVYLEGLENRTPRAQVEQVLTRAIADELVVRQRFDLVADRMRADAELTGAVTGFGLTPVSFDAQGRATEYELSLTLRIAFRRLDNGEPGDVLWEEPRYQFRESYPVDVVDVDYFDRELLAIEEVSGRFARTLLTDLMEGF